MACSEREAFARLYRMHYEIVFRYCSRRLFNRHAAEEVTSTVFFRVMRTISSFKGNSNDFRKWLYRVIFGDLRIEDINSSQLAELEAE